MTASDEQIDIQGVEIEARGFQGRSPRVGRFPSARRNSVVAMGDGCRR
jgi:hypothetical protein